MGIVSLLVKQPNHPEEIVEINTGPNRFKVIVPGPMMDVSVPGFLVINGETTLKEVEGLTEASWEFISTGDIFQHFWNVFWGGERADTDSTIPKTYAELKSCGPNIRHVAGMIIQAFEAEYITKQSVYFQHPENNIHPQQMVRFMTFIYAMFPRLEPSKAFEILYGTPKEEEDDSDSD